MARGLLVGAMLVNSWSSSGATRSPGSQDRGERGPSSLPVFTQTLWLRRLFAAELQAKPVTGRLLSLPKGLLQILARVSLFVRNEHPPFNWWGLALPNRHWGTAERVVPSTHRGWAISVLSCPFLESIFSSSLCLSVLGPFFRVDFWNQFS